MNSSSITDVQLNNADNLMPESPPRHTPRRCPVLRHSGRDNISEPRRYKMHTAAARFSLIQEIAMVTKPRVDQGRPLVSSFRLALERCLNERASLDAGDG